jgi:DNA-binding MarR family transcriptional regulator
MGSDRDTETCLDALDDALVAVRQVLQRPSYRRQLMTRLGDEERLGTIRIVRAVERVGEPCSVGDVADLLAIDPSTASRSVEEAVGRGYLARGPCREDRRKALLQITEQGTVLLNRMTAVRRELLAEVTDDWAPADLTGLVHQLRRLLAGFEKLGEKS